MDAMIRPSPCRERMKGSRNCMAGQVSWSRRVSRHKLVVERQVGGQNVTRHDLLVVRTFLEKVWMEKDQSGVTISDPNAGFWATLLHGIKSASQLDPACPLAVPGKCSFVFMMKHYLSWPSVSYGPSAYTRRFLIGVISEEEKRASCVFPAIHWQTVWKQPIGVRITLFVARHAQKPVWLMPLWPFGQRWTFHGPCCKSLNCHWLVVGFYRCWRM